jgi:hypothetical protein
MTREKLARPPALSSKCLKRNGKPGTRMVWTGAKLSILTQSGDPGAKQRFLRCFSRGSRGMVTPSTFLGLY